MNEADIQLEPATPNQQPILENLLELYAHDFSEFFEIEIGEDGRFGYPNVGLYYSEPGRHPFLLRSHGKLAGFAFVRKTPAVTGEETVWDMAEFFVLRAYRRHGVGSAIAHQLFRRFPGRWEVRVMQSNQAGRAFWQRAIASFTSQPIQPVVFDRGEKHWFVFSFNTPA